MQLNAYVNLQRYRSWADQSDNIYLVLGFFITH